jgi:hypothetical protein
MALFLQNQNSETLQAVCIHIYSHMNSNDLFHQLNTPSTLDQVGFRAFRKTILIKQISIPHSVPAQHARSIALSLESMPYNNKPFYELAMTADSGSVQC